MSKRRGPQQKQDQLPQEGSTLAPPPVPQLQPPTSAAAPPEKARAPPPQTPRTERRVPRQPSQKQLEAPGAAGTTGETPVVKPAPAVAATAATPGASEAQQTPRPQRTVQSQPPLKKIKKEPLESPTPARSARSVPPPVQTAEQSNRRSPNAEQQQAATPAAKRPRAGPTAAAAASAASTDNSGRTTGNIAWVLSTVRAELESILDVEGVRDQLEQFPACVLLGGIAARRELVAALLGEHQHANSAAAALVAPGMRQPIALELRCSPDIEAPNLLTMRGPEADQWLASVSQAASQALGNRLKVDALRLRLSAVGCVNLDVVDLPERGTNPSAGPNPKVDEIRTRHLGSTSNILVCLEPGHFRELCRRFDPTERRTILLGAAETSPHGGDTVSAAELCGPKAARALEERFVALCHERSPKWLSALERLEMKLSRQQLEAKEVAQSESTFEVLRRARATGVSFGRALQHVVSGTPGCQSGALTLEEELDEFAASAAQGMCGTGRLSGQSAALAAAEVWSSFPEGIKGYIAYLKKDIGIASADVPLNGGAAWQRLLEEIEVAMRLAHPPEEELRGLLLGAIQAGGTGVHGHQRWDDVASKLLLTIAFDPLCRRIRYVAARVAWALRQQKTAVADWMATLEHGPTARLYSPLFPQHLQVLRSSPITRELVFGAFDKAAAQVADLLLKNLEGTLSAGCLNPQIMLRPHTEPELDPSSKAAPTTKPGRVRGGERGQDTKDRQRVKAEMLKRSGESGGLPVQLRDRIFSAKDAEKALPHVEMELRRAFSKLQFILANQSFAFSDTTLSALCRRHIDEAMNNINFSPEQQQAIAMRETELQNNAKQALQQLEKVNKCITELRGART